MAGTDWFTYTNLIANRLARASDVNARVAAIQGAFGLLPIPVKIQQGRSTYVEDAGPANALAVSLDFAPASYVSGLELTAKVAAANTGAATIDVNGLGAKSIKRADGTSLAAGDLASGQIIKLVYDGTNFRLIAPAETVVSSYAATVAANAATVATATTTATNAANASALSATAAANSATAAANSAATIDTSTFVQKAGSIMTGALTLSGAPTNALHAATKAYVDAAVFAAGSVSADETTIHSASGVFGLKSIAAATVLGSVGGGVPTALSQAQLTGLVNPFTTTLSGAVPAPGTSNATDFLRRDGAWATPSKLATPRTIAISGVVTGTATAFDGTANITIPITALDVSQATTGTLAVARGGTGVATATGTGSVVLSTSPAFAGTPTAPTAAAGTNTTQIATAAFVQTAVGSSAPALLGVISTSTSFTIGSAHNNALVQCTGASLRTITADGSVATGLSTIIIVTGAAAWTFNCAGGVYTDGATATVTSVSIPSGARCTAVHLGAGVWLLSGV